MSVATTVTETTSVTRAALWPAVSSRDAAAVATRWQERRSVPRAIVVERAEAASDREALRVQTAEEPGCYRGVRSWTSPEAFLAGLRLYLRHYPEALRSPNVNDGIAFDTFMKVMIATAEQAHPATGRGLRAHKKETARQVGCGEDTVQRAWRIATCRLGVLRDIRRGRPLTLHERLAVYQGPRMADGSRCKQRGVTPLRAFHVPAWLGPWIAMANIPARRPARASDALAAHGGHRSTPGTLLGAQKAAESPSLVGFASPPRRALPEGSSHLSEMETCGQDSVSLRSTKGTRSARRLDEGGRSGSRRPRRPIDGERLAQQIAQTLGWSTTRHQSGPRLSPRRTAPALADFERAGWSAHHWLATARAVAQSINYPWPSSSQMIREPGAWVWWLTQHMVPDEPPVEPGHSPAAPPWLQACDRPDCDGHGWLVAEPDATGRVVATKCPDCPPRIREATPVQIEQRDDALATEPQEPVCVACGRTGQSVAVRHESPLASLVCSPCWQAAQEG
ncbi:hypothetical protein [Janibacter terrae]|uniref:hypothetical protein n=1 Tax=Janibacter terrae TaxID=103817 RepID=UPI000AB748DB|nr:hypothetical protein [Janibacter terrae]